MSPIFDALPIANRRYSRLQICATNLAGLDKAFTMHQRRFWVVFFGLFSTVGDHRAALLYAGFLFLAPTATCFFLPRPRD
jgi:hypothetical protein